MAFHTILEIPDPLTLMPAFDIGGSVFVAAIAGEFSKVVVYMTGHTTRIMVIVQFKQFVVIKTQCPPCAGLMALRAA